MGDKHNLNCIGIKCPMPIVEVFKKIKSMEIGDTLIVESDDPAFPKDIEAWCSRMGHELVTIDEKDGVYVAIINKSK